MILITKDGKHSHWSAGCVAWRQLPIWEESLVSAPTMTMIEALFERWSLSIGDW